MSIRNVPFYSVMRTVRAPRTTGNVVSSVRASSSTPIRRQLRDAMRNDRSREVDRLSASSSQVYRERFGHNGIHATSLAPNVDPRWEAPASRL
jgi:hypothetical protein